MTDPEQLLSAKEVEQLVDDLRVARRDLTQTLNTLLELSSKITDLVVLLIKQIR